MTLRFAHHHARVGLRLALIQIIHSLTYSDNLQPLLANSDQISDKGPTSRSDSFVQFLSEPPATQKPLMTLHYPRHDCSVVSPITSNGFQFQPLGAPRASHVYGQAGLALQPLNVSF